MTPTIAVMLAGAVTGMGIALILRGWQPPMPDLTAALERLNPRNAIHQPRAAAPVTRVDRARARLLPPLVDSLRLNRYAADLRATDTTPDTLALTKAGYGLLGLLFPSILAAAALLLGATAPLAVPGAAGLVLGGVLFWVPDLDLRRRAATARESMRRTVCAYTELVALERAADAGTTEALERAATLSDAPEFTRIRDSLLSAQLAGRPPWAGLTALAEDMQIPELGDVADIMRLSGTDGAAVYTTLRARAASLRTHLLTTATARANAASEHMIVPVALLGIAFMALVGYPAFARILGG